MTNWVSIFPIHPKRLRRHHEGRHKKAIQPSRQSVTYFVKGFRSSTSCRLSGHVMRRGCPLHYKRYGPDFMRPTAAMVIFKLIHSPGRGYILGNRVLWPTQLDPAGGWEHPKAYQGHKMHESLAEIGELQHHRHQLRPNLLGLVLQFRRISDLLPSIFYING